MPSGNAAESSAPLQREERSALPTLSTDKSVAAFILAGGRGERLGVLSEHRAKPALLYAGQRPLVDLAIRNCVRSGFDSVGVLAEYRWRSVQQALLNGAAASGKIEVALRVSPAASGTGAAEYRGTADAVRQNLDLVCDRESVVILAGDHVYSMDYAPLVAARRESGADIAIALTEVPRDEVSRFGIVQTNASGRVTSFDEKPDDSPSTLASMGIYVFSTQALRRLLEEDDPFEVSAHDFGRDVLPRALAGGYGVLGVTFDGYWRDVGTPAAFWAASMDLLGPKPPFVFDDSSGAQQRPSTVGAVRFGASGHARNSLLTGACTIEGLADHSVISPGVWIAEGAVVRNSVLLPGARVGAGALVDRAILDEDASIGAGAVVGLSTRGFRAAARGGDEPTVVGRSARIEGGVTIEPHTVVAPDQVRTRTVVRAPQATALRPSPSPASTATGSPSAG